MGKLIRLPQKVPEISYAVCLLNQKNAPNNLQGWQKQMLTKPEWCIWLIIWTGTALPNLFLHSAFTCFGIRAADLPKKCGAVSDKQRSDKFDGHVAAYDEDYQTRHRLGVSYLPETNIDRREMLIFYHRPKKYSQLISALYGKLLSFILGLCPKIE